MPAVTSNTLVSQYQKYFSKQLLTYAVQALKFADFAQKATLPRNSGSNTIRFFRYDAPSTSKIRTLSSGITDDGTNGQGSQGTPISSANYRVMSLSPVDVDLVPYGQVLQLTDFLRATEFFDSLSQAVKIQGQDAALKADEVIRDAINAGTVAANTKYSGAAGAWATSFAALTGGTANKTDFVLRPLNILNAVTQLKIKRSPQIGGSYIGLVSPQVAVNLMQDPDWLTAAQYSNVQALYKGELGSLYGVRFVEHTNPFIEKAGTEAVYDNSGNQANTTYQTIVTGGESYGMAELAGGSPLSPQVIITDKPDKADPLNQQTNVGFKAHFAAKVLNSDYFVCIKSKTTYS